ncbi:amidohydrolase family protein [Ruegeria sp.]|uniref:amidohydrolase family protein n=1 Tax=Ruegeria sp. TaxID=1879320 RepID=UPI002308BAE0|nr:amidohydrolase family protein [Ruegeria sp.]MDA7964909.1 amidohydrolase family protein [Ruegeria sp.]
MTNDTCENRSFRMNRRGFLAGGLASAAATSLPYQGLAAEDDLYLIALEEHIATPELLERNGIKFPPKAPIGKLILETGAKRIADMDAAGIDMQVLSAMTPGAQDIPGQEGIDFARRFNDWMANELVSAYPNRFRAFATLPMQTPEAAADELERAVKEDGCLGCMTYGSIGGKFLDDPMFAPVLAKAEELDVPIYIHPAAPTPQVLDEYYSGLGNPWLEKVLSGPGYGWHQEVALQSLRMIVAGTFDKFPNLKIVIGHMGEGLPFYFWRLEGDLTFATRDTLSKPPQQYLRDNFWITTSAFFQDELLDLALATMGEDRVMFAVDFPFAKNQKGADWLRAADLPFEVKQKIASGNAEKLLGLNRF